MRALVIALALCAFPGTLRADELPDPFRMYQGEEQVPGGLKLAYTRFVQATVDGGVESSLLPHAVSITREARPEMTREYGTDINLPFLKQGFSPLVFSVRKDPDDCYLVRTGTTAIWFVETKSGAWKIYRYLDKPIR